MAWPRGVCDSEGIARIVALLCDARSLPPQASEVATRSSQISKKRKNNAGSSGSLVLIRLCQQQQQPTGAARSSLLLNRERWNLLRAIASRPPARPSGREHRAPLATGGLTNPFPTRTSSRGSSRASHTSLFSTRHPSRSGHPCARAGSSHHVVEALQPGQGPDCHPQRAQQPQGPYRQAHPECTLLPSACFLLRCLPPLLSPTLTPTARSSPRVACPRR